MTDDTQIRRGLSVGPRWPSYVTGDEVGRQETYVRTLMERGTDPRIGLGMSMPEFAQEGLYSEAFGLYAFCTENIKEYLPALDAAGKRCLTVAASGDQTINLLMAGAREVVAFDAVEAAGEVTWLKVPEYEHMRIATCRT